MPTTQLNYLQSIALSHEGDCLLRGISSEGHLFVDELYGDDDWLAQHVITLDGQVIHSIDENYGETENFLPLDMPDGLLTPEHVPLQHRLNFGGARYRGLHEPERIAELVRPLSLPTKMQVIETLGLSLTPPLLFGVAESTVLALGRLDPETWLVCRRLRLAYRLEQVQYDEDRQPYDYDTLIVHVVHPYNPAIHDHEMPPLAVFAGLPGVMLYRPMDCLIFGEYVIVAEGGDPDYPAQIHIWQKGNAP